MFISIRQRSAKFLWVVAWATFCGLPHAEEVAVEPAIPPASAAAPDALNPLALERISPGVFRFGEIVINKKARSITFPAAVNMSHGLLEYVLVKTGGKTHESLLRTAVDPYQLQVAFLLLGLEGTSTPISGQGAKETPTGDPITFTIEHRVAGGKVVKVPPEDWLMNVFGTESRRVGYLPLLYTGSVIRNGVFAAQAEGSIAALFHDPAALIDNTTTGGQSDTIWYAKNGTVPPVGTPVSVTIKRAK